jgi:YHS domain-containing protein
MNLRKIVLLVAVVAIGLSLTACKKKEQPVVPSKTMSMEDMSKKAAATAEEVKTAAASMEQTTCPVSGDKIDKNVFVEYKGKKVYFCCSMCVDQFNKDPEKYIAKLPQFAK